MDEVNGPQRIKILLMHAMASVFVQMKSEGQTLVQVKLDVFNERNIRNTVDVVNVTEVKYLLMCINTGTSVLSVYRR